jgi:hypothetical protein
MPNPFDEAVKIMKAVGVPEAVFARGGQLLRIPQSQRAVATVEKGGL